MINIDLKDVLIDGQLQVPVYENTITHVLQFTGTVNNSTGRGEFFSASWVSDDKNNEGSYDQGVWMRHADYSRIRTKNLLNTWQESLFTFKEIYNALNASRIYPDLILNKQNLEINLDIKLVNPLGDRKPEIGQ